MGSFTTSSKVLLHSALCCAQETDHSSTAQETVPRYTDVQFGENFRMGRDTFELLCQWIAPHLPKERTMSVEKKMLSTIWLLGNIESFRGVADRFAMNKGNLHRVVMKVCKVLTDLREEIICWPSSLSEYIELSEQSSKNAKIPGVVGAIDGTFMNIPGPSNHRESYINRKGHPSFHLQVVCDSSLRFLDIYTGWTGSVHDSRVFHNCPLREKLESGDLPSQLHLIGDSAYMLSTYMLVPFRDNGHLTALEKNLMLPIHQQGLM